MADRVPLEQVIDKEPEQQETTPNRITNANDQSFIGDINYHKTADFLELDGADRNDFETMKKVATVFGWGVNLTGSKDPVDVMVAIKGLKTHLGLSEVGVSLVNKLYQWVKLDTTQSRIQLEKGLLSAK